MDFNTIFQLRTKKFWWMDVVFYFVISLLVSTVLCYVIFAAKNSFLRQDIEKQIEKLNKVGTEQQRADERDVINYKKKINDFTFLMQNHQFTSNVFAFMQQQTMPNVWFKQFSLNEKSATVQLSGEADDLDAVSRQIAVLEKNKYVKSLSTLTSSGDGSARNGFNTNLVLSSDIFDYLSIPPAEAVIIPPEEPTIEPVENTNTNETPDNNEINGEAPANPEGTEGEGEAKSDAKFILSFHLRLVPEVIGMLDQTNYTVTLSVPYGTDIANLAPAIMVSPGAVVSPSADVSQDFTDPVEYTVTAEDGSVQSYAVRVIVGLPPVSEESAQKENSASLIIIIIASFITVVLAVVLTLLVLRRRKSKQQTF